jgi:hypothetical protein
VLIQLLLQKRRGKCSGSEGSGRVPLEVCIRSCWRRCSCCAVFAQPLALGGNTKSHAAKVEPAYLLAARVCVHDFGWVGVGEKERGEGDRGGGGKNR